jgi:hypothetical protein
MATLTEILNAIQNSLQDDAYSDEVLTPIINLAVRNVAAGILLPTGQISPPLPDLATWGTVNTSITLPYASLPTDYQRQVSNVYDSSKYRILPPRGGDYYAYTKFLKSIPNLDLSETGSIYTVCVRGTRIYYQGIPSVSVPIGIHYYKKPSILALDGDEPEGIPDHIQLELIRHWVCAQIAGEIESGQYNKGIMTGYHTSKMYEWLQNMVDFIGVDAEAQYYGEDRFVDAGVCD